MARRTKYPKHLVIPDTQCKAGVPTEHLVAASNYAVEKRPDVIVHLGDHWDFPSLSYWESDVQKAVKDEDVMEDVEAGNEGLALLTSKIDEWNKSHRRSKKYKPRLVYLKGNHDERLTKAIRQEPWKFRHLREHMDYGKWEVQRFLVPIIIDGVAYSHFFCRNSKGTVTSSTRGQPSAHQQVLREGMSATAGHKQGLDVHIQPITGGRRRGIIAGSFYSWEPGYMTPQGQDHWRGLLLKHEVRDGDYDLVECSLNYLLRAYA